MKYEKAFNEIIFLDPWLDSNKVECDNINIDKLQVTSKTAPCEGGFYFPLPKELNNSMTCCIYGNSFAILKT